MSGKKKITKKAITDIALVADSDEVLAKEQFKEALAPKKRKPKKKKEKNEDQDTATDTQDDNSLTPTEQAIQEMTGQNRVKEAEWIAIICISQLKRIDHDDPLRNESFDKIIKWIKENR